MRALVVITLLVAGLFAAPVKVVPFAGIAMNGSVTQDHSGSERWIDSESPLGLFGICIENPYSKGCLRHISSIPQMDETQGANEVLWLAQYKGLYGGVAYNDKMTSKYYTEQISKWSRVIGYEFNYGDKFIFVEYRDSSSDKKDMLMYGIILKFQPEDLQW